MIKRAYISVYDTNGIIAFARRLADFGIELFSDDGTAKLLRGNDLEAGELKDFKKPIDLIVINLPAPEKPEDLENHDRLHHAANNPKSITVVTDPKDYDRIIAELEKNGNISEETRLRLAAKALEVMAHYDLSGAVRLSTGKKITSGSDAEIGMQIVSLWAKPAVAFIKRGRLCAAAQGEDLEDAFINAFECDPKNAQGSLVVLNRPCPKDLKEIIAGKSFAGTVEVEPATPLTQKIDFKIVTEKEPNKKAIADLNFGHPLLEKCGPGFAVLIKNNMTIGLASGQLSAADAADSVLKKADGRTKQSVFITDLPIEDPKTIDRLAKAGVTALVQPGGSAQDGMVIKAADRAGLAMGFIR